MTGLNSCVAPSVSCFPDSLDFSLCVVTGFAVPHGKPMFTLSPGANNQHNLSSYGQLSHQAPHPYQLGGIPEGHSLKLDSGLVTGGTLWDIENTAQPVGSFSGSPGHQQASSQMGMTLQ